MSDGRVVPGKKLKLYIDPDGVGESSWAEASKIGNVKRNGSWSEGEVAERDSKYTGVVLGHLTEEITVELTRRPGNTVYDAIMAAMAAGTYIGVAIADGPIATAGTKAFEADMNVLSRDDDQGHTGTTISISLKLAAESPTAPAEVVVS